MKFEQEQRAELSPALQEVGRMSLNYDDAEYKRRVTELDNDKVSEDAFLMQAHALIEVLNGDRTRERLDGDPKGMLSVMSRVLDRESMASHPKIEVYRAALEDLKEKFGYKTGEKTEE